MLITKCFSLEQVRHKIKDSTLLLCEGMNFLSDEDLLQFAASLSKNPGDLKEKVLHWDFGPVMTMKKEVEAKNYLFSTEKVPFHWDGAFYREPRYLLFYCLESQGAGGETLFSDTESIWKSFSPVEQEKLKKVKLTFETEKKAHYGGKITVPLVQSHPERETTIMRFAEKVETQLNPVSLKIEGAENSELLYRDMVKKLYHSFFTYTHQWKKGDLIIVDNFSLLHGRKELLSNETRSFKRIQIL